MRRAVNGLLIIDLYERKDIAMQEPQSPGLNPVSLKPFLLLLLALAVLAGVSLWLTAWCWPRYGESACGRYVLPIDFLTSLVIFALVALVFDQSWGRLIAFAIVISFATYVGSLVARLFYTAPAMPWYSVPVFLRYLQGALTRMIYLILIQALIPAAILRGYLRGDAEHITLKSAALFGVIIGVVFTVSMTGLFWLVSVIQTRSVTPDFFFPWNDFLSTLTLGLAAFLGVLAGKRLRLQP
jgi:phosphoglycerol transferase MdoB-like AlkP superfamily enzyme